MQNDHVANEANYLTYQGKYKGLLGWILSTDHKRIGLLYLYSIMTMFLIGVLFGLAVITSYSIHYTKLYDVKKNATAL